MSTEEKTNLKKLREAHAGLLSRDSYLVDDTYRIFCTYAPTLKEDFVIAASWIIDNLDEEIHISSIKELLEVEKLARNVRSTKSIAARKDAAAILAIVEKMVLRDQDKETLLCIAESLQDLGYGTSK